MLLRFMPFSRQELGWVAAVLPVSGSELPDGRRLSEGKDNVCFYGGMGATGSFVIQNNRILLDSIGA